MKIRALLFILVVTTVLDSQVTVAQPISLKGRSAVELNFGIWREVRAGNEVSMMRVSSTAKAGGLLGSFGFNYWFQENLAVSVGLAVVSSEATSSITTQGITQQASTVLPIFLGVRYYVPEPSQGEVIRPFLSAALGPILGFQAENSMLHQGTETGSSYGVRVGGGMDFLISRMVKLGANLGYTAMTDFSTPIGARKNFSGPDFSLGIGVVFGSSQ